MSVTRKITIRCDHGCRPGLGHRPCPAEVSGDRVGTLRETMRKQGWKYVAGHPAAGPARDLCPEHAEVEQ